MQPRQLGIIAIAALVAFGAAFGVGKATNKSEAASATTPTGSVKALDVAAAPAVGSITTGSVPALKVQKAKRKKKPARKQASRPTGAPAAPVSTAPTIRRPVTTTTTAPRPVVTQAPVKQKPRVVTGGGVSGGGED